ncbi:hypothetical protein Q0F98_25975 [Paenibacillus amylolyticus]|nr:hypothetical protein Q0F98_25975 [Paenibacillus amylolyticus]
MSESTSTPSTRVVYQANQPMLQSVQNVRNMLHHTARQHIGKKVQVQNIDGQVWEGVVISADREFCISRLPRCMDILNPRLVWTHDFAACAV